MIGLSSQIAQLRKSKRHIILLGSPGTGKTTLATLYCKEKNFNMLQVHRDDVSQIEPFIDHKTIESFFDQRQKAVLLDNIETFMQSDKITAKRLCNIMKKTTAVIIITSCEEKKCSEFKRFADFIRLQHPPPQETAAYISSIIPVPFEEVLRTSTLHQGSVRETIAQLNHGTSNNDISSFRNLSPLECMPLLMSKNLSKTDLRYLIDNEANILSCMFYENIPDELHHNRLPKDIQSKIEIYKDLISYYIASTILEDHMHSNHDWGLWELVYLIRFTATNNMFTKTVAKPKTKEYAFRMSQALSKISHRQIMNKQMSTFAPGFTKETKLLLCECKDEDNMLVNTYRKYF